MTRIWLLRKPLILDKLLTWRKNEHGESINGVISESVTADKAKFLAYFAEHYYCGVVKHYIAAGSNRIHPNSNCLITKYLKSLYFLLKSFFSNTTKGVARRHWSVELLVINHEDFPPNAYAILFVTWLNFYITKLNVSARSFNSVNHFNN